MSKAEFQDFIAKHGWGGAERTSVGSDWSPRRYWRLSKDGKTTLLMQSVDPNFRGHTLADFVRFNSIYRDTGLHVPQIYAADFEAHVLLIEDFGDITIEHPDYEREGYSLAVDALMTLQTLPIDRLARFEDNYVFEKIWLYDNAPEWRDAWLAVWGALPPCPYAFSHMDYRAGNLHWLPHKAGLAKLGILDYQTTQAAPFIYDIVNLLEDARRVLEPDLKAYLKGRYKDALPIDRQAMFDDWYVVMSAQFHLMILGQLKSLNKVDADMQGRLKDYLKTSLQHPVLAPVAKLCDI